MGLEPLRDSVGPPSRTALDLARADLLATLSVQVGGLVTSAARRRGRAGDAGWWSAALAGPARALDDAWARRCGPLLRRRVAASALRHQGARVMHITHVASPSSGGVLAAAAAGVLGAAPARERGVWAVAAVGPAVPVLSLLLAGGRLFGVGGPGVPAALAGLVLLGGVLVVARVRTVRSSRDRALARRVCDAVLAAADRELLRRVADAEPTPAGRAPLGVPDGSGGPVRAY
ncbi:hypothetical protein [Pseudonocardia sp. ICBG1293]|uniref:hypothetical protein n=1 Tax=Pseudonocardia sp. ICBG1293 TaxID=2844382 RepID=UPI001CC9EA09|nr:hypothetical protein [Pseudonocardia sp. ICBG1293]